LILKPKSKARRSRKINAIIGPALLILAALVQATLSPYLKVSGVHPDLVLLLVISWTVLRGLEEGATWALIGGLSLDFLSGAPFGVFSLSLLGVAFLASLFHGRTFGSTVVLPLILVFPLSLFFNAMALLLLTTLGHPVNWTDAFFYILIPNAIYNSGVMMIIFPLLYLLNRRLNPQPINL
jgi:rod shape-determining protein MreD